MLNTTQYSYERTTMKRNHILSIVFCLLGFTQTYVTAQPGKSVKEVLTVKANSPEIVKTTFNTDPGSLYTITVTGSFSFTGNTSKVMGDAWGIYSVSPNVSHSVWPFMTFVNGNDTYPIYVLQLPYSDTNSYPSIRQMNTIPNLSKNVRTRINAFKHLGFRLDGQPLNPRYAGSFETNHTYTFQIPGTGNPFKFNILDSIESLTLERLIPGYSDNVGELTVTIEESVIQFCEKPVGIYNPLGELIALDVTVGVFVKDSNAVSGRKNILESANDLAIFHKVGCGLDSNNSIVDSSFFLCPDSISCDQKKEKGVALAMVLDRSGSMMDFISPTDSRVRIEAAKTASTEFVDRLGPKDEAMIISFSDNSKVDQTWTNNKFLLKDAIDKLIPSGFTAMNEAVIRAIDSIRKHPNPNRAIILLSDGGNNRFPDFNAVVNKIKEDTINPLPIYSIAFGLNKQDPLDQAGLADLKELARLTRGKTFEVYSSASLDSVYQQLTREVINDRCCVIRVPVPPCRGVCDTLRTIKVFMPVNGKVEINTITYRTKCDSVNTAVDETNVFVNYGDMDSPVSELMPNPSNGHTVLAYEVGTYGNVSIEIYAQDGTLIRTILNAPQDQGRYKIALDLSGEPQGYYSVVIKIDGMTIMRPMIITK